MNPVVVNIIACLIGIAVCAVWIAVMHLRDWRAARRLRRSPYLMESRSQLKPRAGGR